MPALLLGRSSKFLFFCCRYRPAGHLPLCFFFQCSGQAVLEFISCAICYAPCLLVSSGLRWVIAHLELSLQELSIAVQANS